eukprot:scaffold4110_cov77-Skeletonema_dohrnii-CCMP3373.AAC.1
MKLLGVTPTCWRNAGVTPVSRNFSAWRTWAYMGVHGRILQASCPRPLKCRVGAAGRQLVPDERRNVMINHLLGPVRYPNSV